MRILTPREIDTYGFAKASELANRKKLLSDATITWQPETFPEIWLNKNSEAGTLGYSDRIHPAMLTNRKRLCMAQGVNFPDEIGTAVQQRATSMPIWLGEFQQYMRMYVHPQFEVNTNFQEFMAKDQIVAKILFNRPLTDYSYYQVATVLLMALGVPTHENGQALYLLTPESESCMLRMLYGSIRLDTTTDNDEWLKAVTAMVKTKLNLTVKELCLPEHSLEVCSLDDTAVVKMLNKHLEKAGVTPCFTETDLAVAKQQTKTFQSEVQAYQASGAEYQP